MMSPPAILCGCLLTFAAAAEFAGGAGPSFRADGPDAERYGSREGFPACRGTEYVGDLRCRVGAFSRFDTLFPARVIAPSPHPVPFRRAGREAEVRYVFGGEERTLAQYLARRPVTGFLIARGDTILVERYQYGRTDRDRLASFSMAKSIVGLLVGIALEEGAIRSLDDRAQDYVPALAGTAYGATPIDALLRMRSGMAFSEDYADPASDIYRLARATLEQDPGGSLAAVRRFDTRRAPPGERFNYASADSAVLGLVLAAATGRTLADYTREKLWEPIGSEARATWIVDATGNEIAYAFVNAVLRDWARLGRLIAQGGSVAGRKVVPRSWLDASLARSGPTDIPQLRYGYHMWHSADAKRTLLWGLRGQNVLADPETGLVLVQTALSSDDALDLELAALWTAVRTQLR